MIENSHSDESRGNCSICGKHIYVKGVHCLVVKDKQGIITESYRGHKECIDEMDDEVGIRIDKQRKEEKEKEAKKAKREKKKKENEND
jgi:hypothetical protein